VNLGWITEVVRVLLMIGDPAMESLIVALGDKDDGVRLMAALALSQAGDRRAIDPLIAALQDRQVMVRSFAAEALGKIGDPQATAPLTAALEDALANGRKGVAKAAREALERIAHHDEGEGWVEYTNKESGFALTHPENWERDFPGTELVLYPGDYQPVLIQRAVIRSPAISVRVSSLQPTSPINQMGRSEFYKRFLADQHQYFDSYQRLWAEPFGLVSGDEAVLWSYEFTREGVGFHAISCLVLKSSRIYIIDGSCLTSCAHQHEGTMRRIVESLALIG
jgi:HEAT repeat protein